MKMVRRTFILGPVILCVVSVSLDTAYSQSLLPRSYLFVEVQDPRGKPAADCSVSISNADGKRVDDVWTNKVLNLATNKVGTAETGFLRIRDNQGQTALMIARKAGDQTSLG
jgi:hypothetical protein